MMMDHDHLWRYARYLFHMELSYLWRKPGHFVMMILLYAICLFVLCMMFYHVGMSMDNSTTIVTIGSILLIAQMMHSLMIMPLFYQKEANDGVWRQIMIGRMPSSIWIFLYVKLVFYLLVLALPIAVLNACIMQFGNSSMIGSVGVGFGVGFDFAWMVGLFLMVGSQHVLGHMLFGLVHQTSKGAMMVPVMMVPFYIIGIMNAQSSLNIWMIDGGLLSPPFLLNMGMMICGMVIIPFLCRLMIHDVEKIT